MTSRREFSFYDPSIQEKFKKIEFEKLEKTQIDAYLKLSPTQWVAPEIHLKEELENPMFLRLFREIYERAPEEAMRLKSRNELLQKYFELDVLADSMDFTEDSIGSRESVALDKCGFGRKQAQNFGISKLIGTSFE